MASSPTALRAAAGRLAAAGASRPRPRTSCPAVHQAAACPPGGSRRGVAAGAPARGAHPPPVRPPRRAPVSPRAYHSFDHPPPPGPFGAAEHDILRAAHAHVPELGFSTQALARGAKDAGYLDISTSVLPGGVFGLVRWHLVSRREALAEKADELSGPEGLGVGQKVERLTWARLMGNKEVVHRWQEALAIMAQPSHVPASLKELSLLADEIWFLAGDVSVDPSWYTKRASLSAVYVASELFMTTDKSDNFQETQSFLRRRLRETQELGGALRSVGQWAGFTASAGLNVLRSKGMRI